jgi:hypothetical protein
MNESDTIQKKTEDVEMDIAQTVRHAQFDVYDFVKDVDVVEMSVDAGRELVAIHKALVERYIDDPEAEAGYVPGINYVRALITAVPVLSQLEATLNSRFFKHPLYDGRLQKVFAKMHRSPKDATWGEQPYSYSEAQQSLYEKYDSTLCHERAIDILVAFVKSVRICDDIEAYIAAGLPLRIFGSKALNSNRLHEFRVFIKDGKMMGYVQQQNQFSTHCVSDHRVLWDAMHKVHEVMAPRFPTCAVDVAYLPQDGSKILEVNPYDETTDLHEWDGQMPENPHGSGHNCRGPDAWLTCRSYYGKLRIEYEDCCHGTTETDVQFCPHCGQKADDF